MQITNNQRITEVCSWCLLVKHEVSLHTTSLQLSRLRLCIPTSASTSTAFSQHRECNADLNHSSMKLWGQYPDLAVFPGSLLLADARTGDSVYPSSPLLAEQLQKEEPGLSESACKDGARLYQPEGAEVCMNKCHHLHMTARQCLSCS